MAKFQLGGGYSGVKTENTQSANKWLNISFWGKYSGVKTENIQSAKKWLNFNFLGLCVLWSQN